MTPITVLDTGKMPLFRYAFGVPPIASATVGCDVWFGADYAYFGDISMTNDRISVNSVNEVTARAGLDVWLDGSILFDLVSLTGYGLPNFELSMPLVITDNQFNSQASQPCFEFALDVAWEAQLGWCPFCIKGGGIENLFAVDQPNGCAISQFQFADRGVPSIALPSIPPIDKTALAVDGLGEASMVWGEGTEFIQVQQFLNGQATVRIALPTGPGAMGIETAYLGLNRQVMVWSQNSLTAEAFRALDGDIGNPLDGDFNTGLNTQHLVYRVRDLSGWSDIMPLTLPGGGDGGVVLAACSAAQSECPQGGEVLAVWVHDASGDINLHDFKLRFAFFDGFSWSPIGEVDPASSAKDVQPAVTYLNGDPVVFWVRNPSVVDDGTTATYDLNQRHLAYRFLRQPAGVQEPIELPQAVASPSIEAFDSDSLVMAFSMATEGDAFLGTRRSLNIAYATQCSGGICQFSGADELLDSSGRRLFVERPKVAVNAQDQAIVTFRQLGVDHATDSDPIGVLQNTGALMQLSFELDPLAVPRPYDPFELSNQGAVNWRVDAIYDPTANAVLASAVQVEDFSDRRNVIVREPIPGVREQRFGGDSGTLVMVERPMLPDFEVLSADLASNAIDPVVGTELAVRLRNNGPITATDVPLATYWNGPAGLGIPGPVLVIDELPGSQLVEAQLTVDLPQSLNINDSHRLYIVINPQGQVIESDGSNNALELVVNGLDVPTNLANVDADNSGTIVIHWDPVEDSRVTGYRVYRRNPDGSILNVGTSKAPGFADFSAYSEQRYEYFVTSHTAQLSESEPSTPILAQTLSQDQLFKDGFE
ncbi:MAG: fibronectin type III domain-containing protein [Pseudomonadota bacterium]